MNSASNPLAGFPSAFRLDGKIAVVTSGARGIGRATVAVLAAAGATVSILDRDAATAETSACTIAGDGPTISVHAADVTDEAALERAFASIMGFSGGGLYPNVSYQATKGAVVNMTRALAVEWAQSGVRVNAVAPTWVRTDLTAAVLDRPGVMERIA
jgi:NAD(P)-dependent dehydrogenase (short-subunit alcohol dehydrogenase family)